MYSVAQLLYVAVQSVVNKMSDMDAGFTVIALITEKGEMVFNGRKSVKRRGANRVVNRTENGLAP